jgi:hypothetical protein
MWKVTIIFILVQVTCMVELAIGWSLVIDRNSWFKAQKTYPMLARGSWVPFSSNGCVRLAAQTRQTPGSTQGS